MEIHVVAARKRWSSVKVSHDFFVQQSFHIKSNCAQEKSRAPTLVPSQRPKMLWQGKWRLASILTQSNNLSWRYIIQNRLNRKFLIGRLEIITAIIERKKQTIISLNESLVLQAIKYDSFDCLKRRIGTSVEQRASVRFIRWRKTQHPQAHDELKRDLFTKEDNPWRLDREFMEEPVVPR